MACVAACVTLLDTGMHWVCEVRAPASGLSVLPQVLPLPPSQTSGCQTDWVHTPQRPVPPTTTSNHFASVEILAHAMDARKLRGHGAVTMPPCCRLSPSLCQLVTSRRCPLRDKGRELNHLPSLPLVAGVGLWRVGPRNEVSACESDPTGRQNADLRSQPRNGPFCGVGALPLTLRTLNGFARQLGHGVRNHVPP